MVFVLKRWLYKWQYVKKHGYYTSLFYYIKTMVNFRKGYFDQGCLKYTMDITVIKVIKASIQRKKCSKKKKHVR